jgi:hypothetical protein
MIYDKQTLLLFTVSYFYFLRLQDDSMLVIIWFTYLVMVPERIKTKRMMKDQFNSVVAINSTISDAT